MQVTSDFTWEELTRSDLAKAHGLDNLPGEEERARLGMLAANVLQPLRDACGRIRVNCAYRSPAVNRLAGGEEKSQHLRGEAADLRPLDCPLEVAMRWIVANLDFDQAILEAGTWIHVSFTTRRPNRRQALIGVFRNGKPDYRKFV